jgi:hypothetical protein
MKVYIGRPKHWISSYSLLTKRLEPIVGEKACDWIDNVIQPILNFIWNDRWWSKQRISIRIDRHDTWNVDRTLSQIICPLLVQLKVSKHGAPHVDDADVPAHLRSDQAPLTDEQKNQGNVDDNHFKRWEWVLDEMIWAFSQDLIDNGWQQQYYSGVIDHKFVKKPDSEYYTLEEGPNHTFAVDREGTKAHQERITRGRLLFAKYYENLWD